MLFCSSLAKKRKDMHFMQSSLQRLRDQLEHGPRLYSELPWDCYDYQSMAGEAKNIMNTSPHAGEQTEARKLYELATARLQFMLGAELEIAACDPGQMSLVQLARHLGKGRAYRIEDPGESRWQAEAYGWAIVRAMNGKFPSNIKQPSSIVLCSQLVTSFQKGVREGLPTPAES
jgi:hypothetical protein